MNDIILLATYWNEKEFVRASLAQIDLIDPIEVLICDGCFDPRRPVHSTDGTYEILKEYVEKRRKAGKCATLIAPCRYSAFRAFFSLLRQNSKDNPLHMLKPARWRWLYQVMMTHAYRRNQAITFNRMISRSKHWRPGRWVMPYDSDQFYSDDLIKELDVTNEETECGLLTAKEKTFFKDFSEYTKDYEQRTWNNMPHKIYANTVLIPTRNLFIEKFLAIKNYHESLKNRHIGEYFHYKLPRQGRFEQTYNVGDRQKPRIDEFSFKQFTGKHPSVIRKHFAKKLKENSA